MAKLKIRRKVGGCKLRINLAYRILFYSEIVGERKEFFRKLHLVFIKRIQIVFHSLLLSSYSSILVNNTLCKNSTIFCSNVVACRKSSRSNLARVFSFEFCSFFQFLLCLLFQNMSYQNLWKNEITKPTIYFESI